MPPDADSVTVPDPHRAPPPVVSGGTIVVTVETASARALSHVPSVIDTKYEVVEVKTGVVNNELFSPEIEVPPLAEVYHRY